MLNSINTWYVKISCPVKLLNADLVTPNTYLLWLMRMRAEISPRTPSLPIFLPAVRTPQPAEEQISSRSDILFAPEWKNTHSEQLRCREGSGTKLTTNQPRRPGFWFIRAIKEYLDPHSNMDFGTKLSNGRVGSCGLGPV